jgi:hypothetical protein
MQKNAMKCNKTQSKWCINKNGASKFIYICLRRIRSLLSLRLEPASQRGSSTSVTSSGKGFHCSLSLRHKEVVTDAVDGAEPPNKAGGDFLAESRWGSQPKLHSGHCHTLPHGGRQQSWYFEDSSHGDGLTEGLDDVQ